MHDMNRLRLVATHNWNRDVRFCRMHSQNRGLGAPAKPFTAGGATEADLSPERDAILDRQGSY